VALNRRLDAGVANCSEGMEWAAEIGSSESPTRAGGVWR